MLEALPEYQDFYEKNLAVYDSQERIAYPAIRGDYVYNFWRDANNERGIWRRTTIEEYRKDEPEWDVILDIDALAESEDENWVWSGSSCLPPDYERCIVQLSRGGADATVNREYDIATRTFIEDGFNLPESKGGMSFIDIDHVFVGTDFGPGSMTESGYPRIVKRWKRGTPLADAEVLYEGKNEDIGVFAAVFHTPEREYPMVIVAPTFFSNESYLYQDGEMKKLDLPADANISAIFKNQLLVSLKSDWNRDGQMMKQGSLVSVDFDQLIIDEAQFDTGSFI